MHISFAASLLYLLVCKFAQYDTKYMYELGEGNGTRQFWFMTPPKVGPNVPYAFGLIGELYFIKKMLKARFRLYVFIFYMIYVIGDLGQTQASNQTLEHYLATKKGQTVLFLGDLSYADVHPFHDNEKWDTFGRFIERSSAYEPWIYVAGNHELDLAPEIVRVNIYNHLNCL